MANEVVVKSGRSLPIGAGRWEIRDDGSPVEFADLLTEARQVNGVVYLSFAASILDADNTGIAQIVARLRMPLGRAQYLHQTLGGVIRDALKPPNKSKAN